MNYDIVIIGASFSGLTLAHHLPSHLKVLIVDRKKTLDYFVESTGLITQATKDLFAGFVDVDRFIPNRITTISVIAPDFKKMFFSSTQKPWIYSTDTPNLIKEIEMTLPKNVELRIQNVFQKYSLNENENYPLKIQLTSTKNNSSQKKINFVRAKFLVGADGSRSTVAESNPKLSKNKHFLAAWEKVFYGNILLGEQPKNTVYHFWFGKFSLGYGGWLSPTLIEKKPAFRIGLAKLAKDAKNLKRVNDFIKILLDKKMIQINEKKEILSFASMVPIGGPLKNIYDKHTLLIGDAAGFCGPFAADGIKGSLVSGIVASKLLTQRLEGNKKALHNFHKEIEKYNKLMTYYKKQLLYRFLWNRMKSNRTFDAMFDAIAREKDHFLDQFCDSKDKNKSLLQVVLRWKNIPLLIRYGFFLCWDMLIACKNFI